MHANGCMQIYHIEESHKGTVAALNEELSEMNQQQMATVQSYNKVRSMYDRGCTSIMPFCVCMLDAKVAAWRAVACAAEHEKLLLTRRPLLSAHADFPSQVIAELNAQIEAQGRQIEQQKHESQRQVCSGRCFILCRHRMGA